MSHTIVVRDTVHYYLESEVKTEVVDKEVYFFTGYIPEDDEDGDSPPEYLLVDGAAYDLAKEVLKEAGLDQSYEPDIDMEYKDISLNTVYVFKQVRDIVTRSELRRYKRSLMIVPVRKKVTNKRQKKRKKSQR